NWSTTVASSEAAKLVLTVALCPEPLATAMLAAAPAVLVSVKRAGVLTPAVVAVTVYEPATVPAVIVSLAWPLELVLSVAPLVIPAPLAGPANVTLAPGTRLLNASRTVAAKGLAKPVLTVALAPEPLVTVMLAAAPAVLASVKFAAVTT